MKFVCQISRSVVLACLFAVSACLVAPNLASSTIAADTKTCGKGEVAIPDERKQGNVLCMPQREWERARKICAKLVKTGEKVNPMECVCQDGNSVGACGD